nr:5665_t:CDS:2 [Entrophospora candida]
MSDKFEQILDHVLNISQSNAETVKTQARLIHELILKFSSCQQSSKHKICTSEVMATVETNHFAVMTPTFEKHLTTVIELNSCIAPIYLSNFEIIDTILRA